LIGFDGEMSLKKTLFSGFLTCFGPPKTPKSIKHKKKRFLLGLPGLNTPFLTYPTELVLLY
jgi:hypothetical protein